MPLAENFFPAGLSRGYGRIESASTSENQMYEMLAEQPWIIAGALGLLGVTLIFGWLQTGKKAAAIIGVIVLALIPLAFFIAGQWQTDREQIEAIIYETAAAIESNDYERAYAIIGDPKAESMARSELPRYEFSMAKINKLRSIEIIEGTFPLQADADMSVKVDVSSKSGGIRNVRVVRRLILKFEKDGEDWIVTDCQHMPVVGGPDAFSTP